MIMMMMIIIIIIMAKCGCNVVPIQSLGRSVFLILYVYDYVLEANSGRHRCYGYGMSFDRLARR